MPNPEKTVWIVRAGKDGENEHFALENDCAVIDWPGMRDFSQYASKEDIKSDLKTVRGETNAYRIGIHAGQIWKFARDIQVGDLVVIPLKTRIGKVAVGKVISEYEYHPDGEPGTRHRRRVEWLSKDDVSRSDMGMDIAASLQSLLTVSRVKRVNAWERIVHVVASILAALADDTSETGTRETSEEAPSVEIPPVPGSGEEDSIEDDDALLDLEEAARTNIYDFIVQNFVGHGMQDLVAEILRAVGFQCEVTPKGRDAGVDILAARGEMGFDSPLLCVQVKSGRGKVGINILNELAGAMQRVGAEKGLLVSWSGFKLSGNERRSNYFSVRLWEAGDLVRLIEQHYDKFSDDFKERLPLKKIWVLNADSND